MNLLPFARNLSDDRPVYAFQATGADGAAPPDESIEAMAARYVRTLVGLQPSGPCLLAGYSGGGIVALEMVRQLANMGRPTSLAVLFDTERPEDQRLPKLTQMARVTQTALRYGPKATQPWVHQKARKLARAVGKPNSGDLGQDVIQELHEAAKEYERVGLVDLGGHFYSVVSEYVLRSYPTNALLVQAAANSRVHYPACWDRHFTGHLTRVLVPGDHFSMFKPEHVANLVAVVEPYLDRDDSSVIEQQTFCNQLIKS